MTTPETAPAPEDGQPASDPRSYEVQFADRTCPRCRSRFVASYYQDGAYVKSRCLDCMLFWPTPMMA
jgi:hypothetical protein